MQLAVVVTHGIGTQNRAFAASMVVELTDRLADRGHDPSQIAWEPILWADLLAPRQAAYLAAAQAEHDLDHVGLRRLVVEALGDAAAYQYVDAPTATYALVHDRFRERIRSLYKTQLGSHPVPLVVMGHSLGSHILSNYIWDSQRGKPTGAGAGASPFERFDHLAGVVTFGSNIPLFTFAHDPVVPIAFPGGALSDAIAARARWLNFFDDDDVLGYPLRPTSPQYAATVDADVPIHVGLPLLGATPLSHNAYWTDNDFTRPVADLLGALIDAQS